jgi:hypothetical protein
MMPSLREPGTRCFFTLGLVSLLAAIALWMSIGARLPHLTMGTRFAHVLIPLHIPIALCLPLFLVSRYRILTPVTISLSFSMSIGLLIMGMSMLPRFIELRWHGLELTILEFEGMILVLWFFNSFFQAFTFHQYGFSSALPVVYITSMPMIGLDFETFLIFGPLVGWVYFAMAWGGVKRVLQVDRPESERRKGFAVPDVILEAPALPTDQKGPPAGNQRRGGPRGSS